jgi:hypothetical protein
MVENEQKKNLKKEECEEAADEVMNYFDCNEEEIEAELV